MQKDRDTFVMTQRLSGLPAREQGNPPSRSFASFPPRLGMDDYAAFVTASLAQTDPEKAARQKAIEEQILAPFRLRSK